MGGERREKEKGRRSVPPLLFLQFSSVVTSDSCCDVYTVARLSSTACVYLLSLSP